MLRAKLLCPNLLCPSLLYLAVILATPADAMLSGYYDSAEKISTILNSAEVADALRQAPIGAISNTGTSPEGNDLWTLRVQDCDLTVQLVAHPPEGTGKTTYSVLLTEPCQ